MLKKGLMRKAALMITVSAMMVTGCGKKENTDSTVIPSTENTGNTQENGMTYSISRPKRQNSFPGPGTISD